MIRITYSQTGVLERELVRAHKYSSIVEGFKPEAGSGADPVHGVDAEVAHGELTFTNCLKAVGHNARSILRPFKLNLFDILIE